MFRSAGSSSAVLALALSLLCPQVASALVIDTFADEYAVEIGIGDSVSNPKTATGGVAAGGAVGGARAAVVERVTGGGSASLDTALSDGETLSVSTGAGVSANALLIYDGETDGTPNTSGLGSIDFTEGGDNTLLTFDAAWDQPGIVISVTFHQGALNSTFDFVTVGNTLGAFQPLSALFGAFSAGPSGGIDFADVGAITVAFNGPTAFDLQIRQFQTAVPEPGSLALLALGLAGLRYAGSRRRA